MYATRALATVKAESPRTRGPAPGIVFVPCTLCLQPVDVTAARDAHGRPVCDAHRAADAFRLG